MTFNSSVSGVQMDADFTVNDNRALTVTNGLTLNGTMTLSSIGSLTYVDFSGTQSLVGSGDLVFGGPTGTNVARSTSGTLTIGPDLTVSGAGQLGWGGASMVNQATVLADGSGITLAGTGWSNEGTIEAQNGGSLTLLGTGWSNSGSGTLQISGGGAMTLQGTYSNSGTMTVSGSTLNLGGSFTNADLGTFTADGSSTIRVTGTLTNSTLDLSSTAAPWQLVGGTIIGGTVTGAPGMTMIFNSSLNGVQMDADFTVSNNYALTVTNGLTLNGTMTLSSTGSGTFVDFSGTQSLLGSGNLVFGGTVGANVARSISGTLTIGPDMTVGGGGSGQLGSPGLPMVNQGTVLADGSGITLNGAGWSNEGTIEAQNGGSLTLAGTGWSNSGSGTLQISGGGAMTLQGTYSNSGTMTVAGSTLNLGGSFTNADLGTFTADGSSTIRVTGTLTNSTLDLSSTAAPWQLVGGTIIGGTVTGAPGMTMFFNSSLNGVQMDADFTVSNNYALTVTNGLTLNGTMTLSSTGSGTFVDFSGTQSLLGSGSMVFGGTVGANVARSISGTLTIGPDMTVGGGGSGQLGSPGLPMVNQGTVLADGSGITLNGAGWSNEGTIEAQNGGSLTLAGTGWSNSGSGTLQISGGGAMTLQGTYSNSGTMTVAGSTLNLGGSFTNADLGTFTADGSSTIRVTGTLTNTTLDLSSTAAPWQLVGGTIIGGTVTGAPGMTMIFNSSLNGVQMDADFTVSNNYALTVTNGLTLNGTMTLSSTGSGTFVDFSGTQSLLGSGNLVFGGTVGANAARSISGTLTIGPDMTVGGGGSGQLGSPGLPMVNQGTVLADGSGQTITLTGSGWSNASSGTIAANGGNISTQGTWSNAGTVSIDHQSSFFATSGYTQTSTGKLSVELGGTSPSLYGTLEVTGTATLDGELEVTTESFSPTTGNTFQAVTSSNASGTFSTEPAGFTTSYNSPGAGDVTIQSL